ncbi:TIR domain-containing protein [Halorubrum ezzemoulense]|uniref:TIR domain-containing protein n=1 Tax=Halorubrum ezzemoulense TaxID=337243 RepID=UPI00232C2451|nr:TIR domain-containing protein [Halorubrum ezzemoulense]MDB2284509.1 TIR domain-containing protein [Halorubrum ezzemoulense]
MARTTFFSFHYDNDIWRASQVRNSDVIDESIEESGFIDGASWESIKREGDDAVRDWINRQMKGCSVTVVLIGSETYDRKWINYEIEKSYEEEMGLVGVRIHKIRDKDGNRDSRGRNPLSKYQDSVTGESLSSIFNTHDWVDDDGRENLGDWVEEAAQIADR